MTGTFMFPRNAFLGFDHIFDELERVTSHAKDTYPPHNVVKYDNNKYDIELAVGCDSFELIKDMVQDVIKSYMSIRALVVVSSKGNIVYPSTQKSLEQI